MTENGHFRLFASSSEFPAQHKESLPHFIRKLQEKKQTKEQQGQAIKAISLAWNACAKGDKTGGDEGQAQ
ncbi:MAG: hypothetical protein MUO52_15810 [Desulfobacterales bacterium]|nr:hypothetical protein [Desulfobacterales bacterium]